MLSSEEPTQNSGFAGTGRIYRNLYVSSSDFFDEVLQQGHSPAAPPAGPLAHRLTRLGPPGAPASALACAPAAQPERRWSDEKSNVNRKVSRARGQDTGLAAIVGADVYRVWTEMLHCLVPQGRTHRLAPLVAGMLRFAAERAFRKHRGRPPKSSLAEALVFAEEFMEDGEDAQGLGATPPGPAGALLSAATVRLFRDAKVKYIRTNARGDRYSIVDAALEEYRRWFAMPWE